MKRKKRLSEESKSTVLEMYQVKYPFCGILKGSVEDNGGGGGDPESRAMLGVQCLLVCPRLSREAQVG